jgi:Zn-dependent alcohol dehydrogenase
MSMRMTAAVMYEQGLPMPYVESQPFQIEEVDLEGPGEGEVLVEVAAAGLCHSDLSVVAGARKRLMPVVGGHEGAGIVREVGRGVHSLKPGDHVVMTGAGGCGQCTMCVDQKPALCDTIGATHSKGLLATGTRRLSRAGQHSRVTSFAQYSVTTPNALIRIDPAVPLSVAAMFGCAVITGVGCVLNTAKVRPGHKVAVIGLGGVGLNAVMASKLAGASRIVGIDISDAKFELARELGCSDVISARDPEIVGKIRDLTGGGVDFCFEVSGASAAIATAFAITRKVGEVICVGLGSLADLYQYPHASLVIEEKVLRGSMMGGSVPARDVPRYIQFFLEGRLPVDRLMSGAMSFDELNANLDALEHGLVLRQILLPHGRHAEGG